MGKLQGDKYKLFASIIDTELKPIVKKVDLQGVYAKDYLQKLGEAGFFLSAGRTEAEYIAEEAWMVRETAKVCMTTAFCLWCHLASLTYVRSTENEVLQKELLTKLESGEILGGTGLSNPMKYYAGLERILLKAEKVDGGYIINGVLPAVSNLGENHYFGIVASLDDEEQMVGYVSCGQQGLSMKERKDYLGLNGSATYACAFKDVFVPEQKILSTNAKKFIEKIRPSFLLYQIAIGLGVTDVSIQAVGKVSNKQNGCNQYLRIQPDHLIERLADNEEQFHSLMAKPFVDWKDIAKVRLDTAYLTLDAVQTAMLHYGSAAYLNESAQARRLREAYFFANLTPTVKHLEKVLCH